MTETTNSRQFKGRIALISPPWPIFSRPSIQLGSLKAYLQAHHPGLAISCHHVYLQMAAAVGYPVYRQLAKEAWLAESIYAALLYPEQQRPARQLFYRQARPYPDLRRLVFEDLVSCVRKTTEEFIDLTDWRALDLAGLSVCLCQLTASLYFIKKIRQKAPELPIILGGSQVGGQTAEDLLKTFAEIDLIVAGEGELPLSRLISHLQTGGGWNDLPDFPGRVRRGANASAAFSFSQLPDLGPLPAPDYSDYFTMLATFSPDKKFFPTLPVEMSRGCWWRSGTADRPGGCAFCNLNVQWHGYRSKEPAQVTEEIERLTGKHRVLSTAFMDNALPPKKSRELFQMLAESGQDVQCFSELRATTERRTLEDYRKGGMTEVQIGIEALSDGLLKKLNKGTTVMDNLAVMKNCEALGLKNLANLILHFPGSDETDVTETLRVIRFARIFRPLRIVHFWLGMHSPVWENPRAYGLRAVFTHPFYKYLFPEDIRQQVRFMIQDYRGDKQIQRKLWRPVARAVRKWQKEYERLHSEPAAGPILTRRDGGNFLILRERKAGEEPVNHRLEGASRRIYLFCDQPRRFEELREHFAPLPADRIQSFLDMMCDKQLMFQNKDRVLSLAVWG